jgi:chaperonin GroES
MSRKRGYHASMAQPNAGVKKLETVEPVGKRVLIRKDEDRKITKVGIHLPDKIEIPTITGRVVAISAQVARDEDYPIRQYDRILFNPRNGVPVDFEGDNRLFVIPVEDVVAVFRSATAEGA